MFEPDRTGLRFGPFWFAPGYSGGNVVTVLFAAVSTLLLVTFMGFVQPFLLQENFHIPRPAQGSLTGNLAAAGELASILVAGLLGSWSDKVGRRFVFVSGMLFMGVAYFLYPLARSIPELFVGRVFYSVCASAAALMLTACMVDTVQEVARAKWVGTISIFNGIGVLLMALMFARMPHWFVQLGFAGPAAGRYSYWTIAGICIIGAVVLRIGLRGGVAARPRYAAVTRQLLDGMRAGVANPRLALAYGSAFIGRGDLLVIGTFFPLWFSHAGADLGIPTGQSLAKAGVMLGSVNIAGLLWAYCMGIIADRMNRVTGLCIALGTAATGYTLLGLVQDPFGLWMIPICVLVGVGQTSVIVAGGALLGQESVPAIRGAIVGLYSTMASAGILFVTFIGGQLFSGLGHAAPFIMMGILNALLLCMGFLVRFRASVHAEEHGSAEKIVPVGE